MPSPPEIDPARAVPTLVLRGTVAVPGGIGPGWVGIRGAEILVTGGGGSGARHVSPVPAGHARTVDLGSWTIAPGFVDVHVHGGGGAQVSGGDPDAIQEQLVRLARFHARHGTTALLATTVAQSPERLRAAVTAIGRAVRGPDPAGAAIAGAHLEGPWLSPLRAGAHDPAVLRPPDARELASLIDASGDTVRLVTLAPELRGASALIAAAVDAGVRVSVGHTEATCAQTQAAFDAGARHLTHLGNAMPGLDRREPGPIGAALADPRVTVEAIADGHHVHPALLRVAAAAAPGRLVAITDAIAAAGMPDGAHRLGERSVTVRGGRAVLTARPQTLAGSVLTMDGAVRGLVAAGVPLADALRAAAAVPAQIVGDPATAGGRGVLAPGHRADLVVLDDALAAAATIVAGRVVYDRDGRFGPG